MSTTEMATAFFKLSEKIITARIKRMSKREVAIVLERLQKKEVREAIDAFWGVGTSDNLVQRLRNKAVDA